MKTTRRIKAGTRTKVKRAASKPTAAYRVSRKQKRSTTKAAPKPSETPQTLDAVTANLLIIETLVADAFAAYGATRANVGWATVKHLPDVLSDIAFRLRICRSFANPQKATVAS